MFESISSKIEKALHTLRGKGSITDINVAETVKEVRKALLDADVSYPVAKEFTDKVKAEAMGRNVIQSIEPGQLMVKIVHEKLTELMGNAAVDINIKGTPAIILIAGLQGSGKTTFSAKLAHYLKTKRNKSVMLVAGDVYRPAAISQLKTLLHQLYGYAMDAYQNESRASLDKANAVEQEIDDYTRRMEDGHIARMEKGICTPSVGAQYLELSSNAERIADHLINIAKSIKSL